LSSFCLLSQRSVPKGHGAAIGKLKDQIDALIDDRDELEDWIDELSKKSNKSEKAARSDREDARLARRAERREKALAEAKAKVELKKADHAKLRAAGKEVQSEEEEEDYGVKDKSKSKPTDVKKAQAALEKLRERIVNYEAKLALRDANKEVALGTSKINYMDPRITVAWCKAKEVPLEMVFNKSLVTKFPWAMEVTPDWAF
jgi:DNA topoisomerase-1